MASINLFGYFFFEVDAQETVLVIPKGENSWDFSINTRIQSSNEIERTLEHIVASMVQRKTISFESLAEGSKPYSVIEIPDSTAHFVKIEVRKPSIITSDENCWVKKEIFSRNTCASPELLNLLMNDYVVLNDGMKILECVDAIVYRLRDKTPEFLLLRRGLSNSDEFKSEYPKGGLKYHETVKEGAFRELKEETGVSSYAMKNYLGLKVVDVRDRKREYDILRVHGLAFEYFGSGDDISPSSEEGFDEVYDWVPFDEAVKRIWMRTYGVEFLNSLKPLLL